MSTKFALVSTLAGVLFVNGLAVGAVPQVIAKDAKKHDKKPVATATASTQRSEEKKKDDEKKQELAAKENYQPALMKPASWRHFQQQQHRHNRSMSA